MNNIAITVKRLLGKDFHPYISVKTYRYGLGVTFGLFVLFGLIDYMVITDTKVLADTLMVRYMFIVPVYVISFLLTYHHSFERHQPILSFLLGLCTLAALMAMLYLAKRGQQDYYNLYFTAFVLAVSFAPLVLWYNKLFMFLSLPLVLLPFNITSLQAHTGEVIITYVVLQNILLLTGGILGSYCRYFVINILRWNIHKNGVITQRKVLLDSAHKKLEDSDSMKRLLLSILSHDLKGPINNVQALLHLLSEKIITPEEFNSQSKNLQGQLTHTKGILDNVLLWSKSEMNVMADHDLVALHEVVSENISGSEIAALGKHITFVNNIPPTLTYLGDRNLIKLVLRNLLANAVKFTENGSISLSATETNGLITLSVKDEGIGMDEDEVAQLFSNKSFSKEGTRSEKGTGLGLAICHEVVKKYGGRLSVETEKGKGTTFYFTLPTFSSGMASEATHSMASEAKKIY
ncbi:hypothetical protein C900_01107 [Fulvivirga imtechensis AK7]|uniref:histidine kinase n=1 Tax=Fulvivirga imtechensis AK7 TaxID=1237149 RepID=L8JX13_9BACT|nr:HAMP domain-containing sensor histidine kinase [Fulvivirga imtechensis]ELR72728.1 hypothetical protein C900_01107 [Fulvivirga imtechensis AK7]